MDIKYDAWVIESLSHGILPIVDAVENTGSFGIPVKVIGDVSLDANTEVAATVTPAENSEFVVSPADGSVWPNS